ncbi:hypothetical protein J6590_066265 [Homalodisca vitripennis]|nr:hypothetical protein J6590_066265 [Homalodisca vitripennis]
MHLDVNNFANTKDLVQNLRCDCSANYMERTLACLFKTQITRCVPAAQRFALLALLEQKLTRACKVQAQINSPRFIEQEKLSITHRTNAEAKLDLLTVRPRSRIVSSSSMKGLAEECLLIDVSATGAPGSSHSVNQGVKLLPLDLLTVTRPRSRIVSSSSMKGLAEECLLIDVSATGASPGSSHSVNQGVKLLPLDLLTVRPRSRIVSSSSMKGLAEECLLIDVSATGASPGSSHSVNQGVKLLPLDLLTVRPRSRIVSSSSMKGLAEECLLIDVSATGARPGSSHSVNQGVKLLPLDLLTVRPRSRIVSSSSMKGLAEECLLIDVSATGAPGSSHSVNQGVKLLPLGRSRRDRAGPFMPS